MDIPLIVALSPVYFDRGENKNYLYLPTRAITPTILPISQPVEMEEVATEVDSSTSSIHPATLAADLDFDDFVTPQAAEPEARPRVPKKRRASRL